MNILALLIGGKNILFSQPQEALDADVFVKKQNYDQTRMLLEWKAPITANISKYMVVVEKKDYRQPNTRSEIGSNNQTLNANDAILQDSKYDIFSEIRPDLDFASGGSVYIVPSGRGRSADLINLLPGTDYYVKIYGFLDDVSLDPSSNNYSMIYTAGPFPTLSEEIAANPGEFKVTAVTTNSITLQWNEVAGAEQYLILASEFNSVQSGEEANNPADKYTYFNPDYDRDLNVSYKFDAYPFNGQDPFRISNAKVVYNGDGGFGPRKSITITGLNKGTEYHFRIINVNKDASDGSENYYTENNPTASAKTLEYEAIPGIQDYNVRISKFTGNTLDLSWLKGDGAGSMVVVKEGSSISAMDMPVSGNVYSGANNNFNLAPSIGAGRIVYQGQGNTTTVTGLTGLATYYIRVFAYNGDPTIGTAGFNLNTALNNPVSTNLFKAKNVAGNETLEMVGSFELTAITPNPAKDKIYFNVMVNKEDQPFLIEIFTINGERIMTVLNNTYLKLGDNPFTVPFFNIASGNYILKVTSGEDIVLTPFTIVQ
ncbi:MAG: T9SS type A sorting domain-containing protein [Candidatus Kapabacteria bacterium]|nr:T9SS type A sorting domain-containing protein [Candidatus Kapabacteria bacterium]